MTKQELQKHQIISHLWEIVKLANDEEICMADLMTGIPDGETPDDNVEYIQEDFKHLFKLYSNLAIKALKDGLYLEDGKVYASKDNYKEED